MNEKNEITEEDVSVEDEGLTLDDFSSRSYVKNPRVGEKMTLHVLKVNDNPNTCVKNPNTGEMFDVGLRNKDGVIKRTDLECEEGIYTISSWEVFCKLFGKGGVLSEYARAHDKRFAGARITIVRNFDGSYANIKPENLAKILGVTIAEATKHQETVKQAIRERRLFDVRLEP